MKNESMQPGFDPYQPLEQSLKFGDTLNRWILWQPRQKIARLLAGQRVLDVCCGTGNLSAMLVAAGCQVTGVDSSPTMLSHARGKGLQAEFQQMDATGLPFRQEFDAAVIGLALHEMPAPVREKVWEMMRLAVRPNGRLLALDYAAALKDSFAARLAARLIDQDEREFLKIYAEHYYNFQKFMQDGGLPGWVRKQGQTLQADYRFLGGTVAVVVAGVA
ncbi:MAG TPA: class I SAM-dependent methyltransferase [Anaerolineales bacterium]|jgi:ubiquinone/menaquinone biosynthesis C-methylase UbiE